jgi:hypothetical protein
MSQQTCVRGFLNARMYSSRSDLVAASPLAQEISAPLAYPGARIRVAVLLISFFLRHTAPLKGDAMIMLGIV